VDEALLAELPEVIDADGDGEGHSARARPYRSAQGGATGGASWPSTLRKEGSMCDVELYHGRPPASSMRTLAQNGPPMFFRQAMSSLLPVLALLISACDPAARPPPATGESPAKQTCPEGKTWDSKAEECRLYPGGGYGWAGCSMRESKGPPTGGTCITGT